MNEMELLGRGIQFLMSLKPEYRKCPKCGKRYSWNPDARQIHCPHCMGMGESFPKIPKILKKKSK